jgi:hypothetical protein
VREGKGDFQTGRGKSFQKNSERKDHTGFMFDYEDIMKE